MFDLAFKMSRPGKLHQQPHQQRGHNGKAGLVEKPDGYKAKHEWMGRAPEPKVLVQNVNDNHCDDEQRSFHDLVVVTLDLFRRRRQSRRTYQHF